MEALGTVDRSVDVRRYFTSVEQDRTPVAHADPVCLYLETTNRCNLLCTTCPRTFEDLEPPADMSWDLFTSIVDQFPKIARVVMHGVGEPMMVKELPQMVRYLKDRGTYVLFNTNGTLLTEKNGRKLVQAGLDELRVSLDAADARTFEMVRGKDYFQRIVRNVRNFTAIQAREGLSHPRVSLWLTGLRETIDQLPDFVRLAHDIGVREVHLQRLVFFEEGQGMAQLNSALFEQLSGDEAEHIHRAEAVAAELGVMFDGSGATEPGTSLKRADDSRPWSLCSRPWTLMYFTAHGRALPCCIAPFSMRGYDSFTLGNANQGTLREMWNGPAYQSFRAGLLGDMPPQACASCGLRWSL